MSEPVEPSPGPAEGIVALVRLAEMISEATDLGRDDVLRRLIETGMKKAADPTAPAQTLEQTIETTRRAISLTGLTG